ncbi:YolD-like family protein [Niallia oryzisoli]|uniref:YolD-like family protein n=1 Tax=Niallia oryzisoli TaxID=1737571 RepID=UPI0037352518
MIRDRGRIKWVSMMLPEHVKVLREWAEEDTFETKKELDEQQLEIMNEIIAEAMEYNQPVTIIHFRDRKYELLVGQINNWDGLNGRLHVVDRFGEEHRIELQNIMDVQQTG